MAIALLSHEVSGLTLGKPSLAWLAASASVRVALIALKQNVCISEISVWDCAPGAVDHQEKSDFSEHSPCRTCRCVGKICMQMIICYLATDDSLSNLSAALNAPITALLENNATIHVQHIDPGASLLEALVAIGRGAQNLVVQITDSLEKHGHSLRSNISLHKRLLTRKVLSQNGRKVLSQNAHHGLNYCWLTHEDLLRFLLGHINVFSPLPLMSIKELGIIDSDVVIVGIDEETSSNLEAIKFACSNQTAVAVVDKSESINGSFQLLSEISRATFQSCDETAAVALASCSVGSFLAYVQDWRSTPHMLMESMSEKLARMSVSSNLREQNLDVVQLLHDLEISSDDEFGVVSPTGPHEVLHRHTFAQFHGIAHAIVGRSHSDPLCCRPSSSMIAVLMQALTHRELYVWVTNEEDNTLAGIVTLEAILKVLLDGLDLT